MSKTGGGWDVSVEEVEEFTVAEQHELHNNDSDKSDQAAISWDDAEESSYP